MTRRIIVALLVLAALGALVLGARYGLALRERSRRPASVAHDAGHAVYQCAMHPQIVSDRPGVCPICHMQLQRVDHAEAAAASAPAAGGDPEAASAVPGHAAFSLPAERQQLIGVKRERVERRRLEVRIRAVGRVAYDPLLYQAVVEYREALRSRAEVSRNALREAHQGADAIVRGARLKLRQQGLSDAQIDALAARTADPVELLLPGKAVWVYAQVYEYEAPLVATGQAMTVTSAAYPGRTFAAKVLAVDPILDPKTRTVRVRGLVETPAAELRPESFVDVTITVPLGERLALPEDAVLDTGEQKIVFVVEGEGRFTPRAVALGRDAAGFYEVLAGLEAGEEVVTSANFLIDSESRFRAALASFKGAKDGGAASAAPQHVH
jgi:Cu(I)/Ag(I) efflux system membrane fusion protein